MYVPVERKEKKLKSVAADLVTQKKENKAQGVVLPDNRSRQLRHVQRPPTPIIQKAKKEVINDLKNDKYDHLSEWVSELQSAVAGQGVTEKLTNAIDVIITAVSKREEDSQRGVYDDLRRLIARYNHNNPTNKIDTAVPSLPPRAIQTNSAYFGYPDSPTHYGMSQEEASNAFSSIFENAPTTTLRDREANEQSIPVIDSFANAGKAVRYQQYAKDSVAPRPFSVKIGEEHTLFEYRNDYVATPLKRKDDAYMRDGQIDAWAGIISRIDSETTVQDILNIINNDITTQPTAVQLEVAGAMTADTKNSIKNWITVMNSLPKNETIKKLLSTEYKGFVDSRSFKTSQPHTEEDTTLGGKKRGLGISPQSKAIKKRRFRPSSVALREIRSYQPGKRTPMSSKRQEQLRKDQELARRIRGSRE